MFNNALRLLWIIIGSPSRSTGLPMSYGQFGALKIKAKLWLRFGTTVTTARRSKTEKAAGAGAIFKCQAACL